VYSSKVNSISQKRRGGHLGDNIILPLHEGRKGKSAMTKERPHLFLVWDFRKGSVMDKKEKERILHSSASRKGLITLIYPSKEGGPTFFAVNSSITGGRKKQETIYSPYLYSSFKGRGGGGEGGRLSLSSGRRNERRETAALGGLAATLWKEEKGRREGFGYNLKGGGKKGGGEKEEALWDFSSIHRKEGGGGGEG